MTFPGYPLLKYPPVWACNIPQHLQPNYCMARCGQMPWVLPGVTAELRTHFHFLFQTIGAAFGANKIIVGNKSITLGIWV